MIVAIYDVTGIQSFVFASRKMKENVGASQMVDLVLSRWLPESIKKQYPKANTEWQNDFIMPSADQAGTIVYIGGGNAMVIYKSENEYLAVNRVLSRIILDETGNELQVASAWVELTDDLSFLRKQLFTKLATEKATGATSLPLQGIGITRACNSDGLPAVVCENNEYLSLPTSNKRRYADDRKNHFEKLFSGHSFPDLLDDLGGADGNSHLSVVHIDGNSMGTVFNSILSECTTPEAWFGTMRSISCQISEAYVAVFREMLQILKNNQNLPEFQNVFSVRDIDMLLRPLIVNGDDITFLTDGRLGIPLARLFLDKLQRKILNAGKDTIKLTACAGVAIVKSHFPFYRAYKLAEELCASSKKKAKALDGKNYGCWIDWHIAQGGLVNDLGALRIKQYNVPGMGNPGIHGLIVPDLPLYNLLFRPWKVGDGAFCFDRFLNILKGYDKLPRSRWKTLRNNAIISEKAISNCLLEMESRGYELPIFNNERFFYPTNGFSNLSPYFDGLETGEFYYELDMGENND